MQLKKWLFLNGVGIVFIVTGISGCAKNRQLAPPPDSEKVMVTVKASEELKVGAIGAFYRSKICTRLRGDGNGGRVEIQGFNYLEVVPKRRPGTDLSDGYVSLDGGGSCEWRLSAVKFTVEQKSLHRFGMKHNVGYGADVEVYFDQATSQGGSSERTTAGDVKIVEDYYPWVSEVYLGGHAKIFSFFKDGKERVEYLAPQARNIYFEPKLHADYLVSSVQADVKDKKDLITTFTYPDGTVSVERRSYPDFKRLQAIRKKAEAATR